MTEPEHPDDLSALSERLAALDVDPARARQIAESSRDGLAHGRPKRRFVEPIVVAIVVASFLIWALIETFG